MFTREEICEILRNYSDTGVTVYKKNGSWHVTHTQGDDHATDIVSGKIGLWVAMEEEKSRQRYLRGMRRR